MNRFAKRLCKTARAPGEDHLYRSDCVIFYTTGRLACSLTAPDLKHTGLSGKRSKPGRRLANTVRNINFVCRRLPF